MGFLRRVEVEGAAVCLGRTADGLGRLPGHVHPRGVLARGRRARGRRRRLPVSRVGVRPAHRRRALPAGARAAADLRGARRGGRAPGAARRRPPAAAEAVHEREDHVSEAVARAATTAGPSIDGLALDDVDLTDLDAWERGCPVRVADAAPPRGAALLAGRGRRPRLLGRSRATTTSSQMSKDWETYSSETRRDVARGPDAGGGRGAQVDARHRPARAHAPARARQQGLHAAGREHVRGAHPRPRARDPRAGVRAATSSTGSRTSPRRSRCGCSPRSWACPSTTGGS